MFQMISMRRLEQLLEGERNFLLLDVREPEEYAAGHLEGAVNSSVFQTAGGGEQDSYGQTGDSLLFPWEPEHDGSQGTVADGLPGGYCVRRVKLLPGASHDQGQYVTKDGIEREEAFDIRRSVPLQWRGSKKHAGGSNWPSGKFG